MGTMTVTVTVHSARDYFAYFLTNFKFSKIKKITWALLIIFQHGNGKRYRIISYITFGGEKKEKRAIERKYYAILKSFLLPLLKKKKKKFFPACSASPTPLPLSSFRATGRIRSRISSL